MTDRKILDAVAECKRIVLECDKKAVAKRVEDKLEAPAFTEISSHMLYMCEEIPLMLSDGRREKVMRWLGFMQGVIWSTYGTSLKSLKKMNMPDGGVT